MTGWGSLPSLSWSRWLESMVPGRDGERIWNTDAWIIVWFVEGGVALGVVARGGESSGESAHYIRGVADSASSSHCPSDILRKWDRDGAGMCDGVFGRERGDVALKPAAWEQSGGR